MATDSVWKWAFLLALLLVVAGVALLRHRSGCPFRIGQVLGSALIFGLLGPPLGGLMLGLGVLVIESGSRGIGLLLFLMLASYLLGLVPAVAGGLCAGLLRPLIGGWARVVVVAWLCALTSTLFGLAIFGLKGTPLLLLLGGLSGLVLEAAWLAGQCLRACRDGKSENRGQSGVLGIF
ncbi:hypothetical protein [Pseudoxanthomonas suwonensis]